MYNIFFPHKSFYVCKTTQSELQIFILHHLAYLKCEEMLEQTKSELRPLEVDFPMQSLFTWDCGDWCSTHRRLEEARRFLGMNLGTSLKRKTMQPRAECTGWKTKIKEIFVLVRKTDITGKYEKERFFFSSLFCFVF